MASDAGHSSLLVLLDLSSPFDTVDHNTLINRLRECVGISGVVLDWFRSYLKDRSFTVSLLFSFKKIETSNLARLLNCVAAIKHWMADNLLQLNPDKTEVLIIALDNLVLDIMQHIGPLSSSVCPVVRNLGVLFGHSVSVFHIHKITGKIMFLPPP